MQLSRDELACGLSKLTTGLLFGPYRFFFRRIHARASRPVRKKSVSPSLYFTLNCTHNVLQIRCGPCC